MYPGQRAHLVTRGGIVVVGSLVVQGDSVLRHLRRARSAGEVSVSTNRRHRRSAGGEVVIRDGLEGRGSIDEAVSVAVVATVCGARMEGTVGSGGSIALETCRARAVHARVPVDGVHAVVEVGGLLELRLSDDVPSNDYTTDGRSDSDNDGNGRLGRGHNGGTSSSRGGSR